MKLALIALAGAGALAACVQPSSAPPPGVDAVALAAAPDRLPSGQCFRTRDMRNHTVADDRTLYVDVAGRDTYRIDMAGACLAGATSSDPLVVRQPPGSAIVCRPIDLDISISKGGFPTPCIIGGISRLTPEQVASLPPKIRP